MDKKNFLILLTCTVIAAFIGAFAASYIVSKPKVSKLPPLPSELIEHQKPPIPGTFEKAMEQQDKMFEQDMKFFDKFNSDMDDLIEHSPNSAGFIQMNNVGLKTIETPKEYKITMDLKPFGNNTKNVNIKTSGHMVKISAGYQSKGKKDYNSSQFYQAITLPAKINPDSIKKEQKGNELIITIPKK